MVYIPGAGVGGGGRGATSSGNGVRGDNGTNTGGGGGGSVEQDHQWSGIEDGGGSGIAVVRYKIAELAATSKSNWWCY